MQSEYLVCGLALLGLMLSTIGTAWAAADLIGQLGDVDYLRKVSGLFHEFQETGAAEALGYTSASDLRQAYPKFFWNGVRPYIEDALGFLPVTQDGKTWIANLYGNVFAAEHGAPGLGRPG